MKILKINLNKNHKSHNYTWRKNLPPGTIVVVPTKIGLQLGTVNRTVNCCKLKSKDTNNILRVANKKDLINWDKAIKSSVKMENIFLKQTRIYNPEINLVLSQHDLNMKTIEFIYVANKRVDFRKLLNKLYANMKIKIKLTQIEARDRAQIIGGIGVCGRELCCNKFIDKFNSVSIKEAKNQNIGLSDTLIIGCCQKLKCCLKYESNLYE